MIVRTILAFGFLCFFNYATAEDIYACGPTCTSVFKKADILKYSLAHNEVFSIIDTEELIVYSYRVDRYFKQGELMERARRIPTTAYANEKYIDFISARHSLLSKTFLIPSDLPGTPVDDKITSAHQLIYEPQLSNRIGQYLNTELDAFTALGIWGVEMAQIFKKIVEVNGFITVTFPDGSTARFGVTAIEGLTEFDMVYIEGSA